MARVDYYAIEQGIETLLKADTDLSEANIAIEEELTFQRGDTILIYLDRRDAPAEEQTLSAGTRTRLLVTFSIWCFHFGMSKKQDVLERRDDLIGNTEIALMQDRTLSGTVETSWLVGGEFQTGPNPEGKGYGSGGEIQLVADVNAIT